MTDSMDKNLKEKRDNFDVDLDAMQDEAEPSFMPTDEFQDENDAFDRLLMNIPLNPDDVPPETNEEMDALLRELDDFPDVVSDTHRPELPTEGLFAHIDTALADAMADDADLDDTLSESIWLQGDETEAPILTGDGVDEFSDFSDFDEPEAAAEAMPPAASEADDEMDWPPDEETEAPRLSDADVDEFSDFSDFDEPETAADTMPSAEVEAVDDADWLPAAEADALMLADDDVDGFSDFSDFNEPEAAAEAMPPAASEADDEMDWPPDEETEAPRLSDADVDEFSDFSDFNEPETAAEAMPPAASSEADLLPAAKADAPNLADDNTDDFSNLNAFNEPETVVDTMPPAEVEVVDEADWLPDHDDLSGLAATDEADWLPDQDDFSGLAATDEADWLLDHDDLSGLAATDGADWLPDDGAEAETVDEADWPPDEETEAPRLSDEDADDFSNFNGLTEPEAAAEAMPPAASEADDEMDWPPDEETEAPRLSDEDEDADDFSDFNGLTEPEAVAETMPLAEMEADDEMDWPADEETEAPRLSDEEVDDFSDFNGLTEAEPVAEAMPLAEMEANDEADWLRDDGAKAETVDEADWLPDDEVEAPSLTDDNTDDFSDFGDFNEAEAAAETLPPVAEVEPADEADWLPDDEVEAPSLTDDDTDDFSDFGDFNEAEAAAETLPPVAEVEPADEADWLPDDEVEAPSLTDDDTDDFSDFGDFNEAEAAAETLPPVAEVEPADEADWLPDAEANWQLDDDAEAAAETLPPNELEAADETEWLPDDGAETPSVASDNTDNFSGFNSFDESEADDESEWLPDYAAKAEVVDETNWLPNEEAEAPSLTDDNTDDFSGFNGLNEPQTEAVDETEWLPDDEDESDWLPDYGAEEPGIAEHEPDNFSGFNESETMATDSEQSVPATKNQADVDTLLDQVMDDIGSDWPQDDEAEASGTIEDTPTDEQDDFSDFRNFSDSEPMMAADTEQPAPAATNPIDFDTLLDQVMGDMAAANTSQTDAQPNPVDAIDSEWLQDDETETTANLTAAAILADSITDDTLDDFSNASDFNTATDDVPTDFPDLDAVFDDSGLIQDNETEALTQEPTDTLQDQEDADSFNSLFPDSDFDDDLSTDENKYELNDNADLNEMDELANANETADDLSKRLQQEAESAASEEEIKAEEENFLLPDFDITADSENTDPLAKTSPLDETPQASAENKSAKTDSSTLEKTADVQLEPFEFEQEEMKKQLDDALEKLKKAKTFSYLAFIFGGLALIAAVGFGVMTYTAKTEVSALTDTVSTLETNLEKTAADNSNEEINAVVNSMVQLNQQFYELISDLKDNPQLPAEALNNKVPNIVAKQHIVSNALKSLHGKIPDLDKTTLSELSIIELPKIQATPVPPEKIVVPLTPPVKIEAAMIEPAPTPEAESVAPKQPKVEAAEVKTKPKATKPKPVKPKAAMSAKTPTQQPGRPTPRANWGVNLAAFKQEWFAQSKAAEFARQGIYADIVPIQGNSGTMYRLRVSGFASKQEANASKEKIKQALNLDSVWVSDN